MHGEMTVREAGKEVDPTLGLTAEEAAFGDG